MSVDFSNITNVRIPEGNVTEIKSGNTTLWSALRDVTIPQSITYTYKSYSGPVVINGYKYSSDTSSSKSISLGGVTVNYIETKVTHNVFTTQYRYARHTELKPTEVKSIFEQFGLGKIGRYTGTLKIGIQTRIGLVATGVDFVHDMYNPPYTLTYNSGTLINVTGEDADVSCKNDGSTLVYIYSISL